LTIDGFCVRDDLAALPPEAPYLVDLAPGDALVIPVGWFHRVLALAPSFSFPLLRFRRRNDFSWFHPASVPTRLQP
jgi:ribosomal protein L16 Arg81 hydroxylase